MGKAQVINRLCALCGAVFTPESMSEVAGGRCARCAAKHLWDPAGTLERPVWRCRYCGVDVALTAHDVPPTCRATEPLPPGRLRLPRSPTRPALPPEFVARLRDAEREMRLSLNDLRGERLEAASAAYHGLRDLLERVEGR